MSTLADVALLAGVSKATASRAFSRPEAVAPATAAQILDAAAKLGFVPNSAARQLARGRTGIVALVVPTLANSFFAPVIAGAQSLCAERDMQLTVAVHHFTSTSEVSSFERISRQADGFIFAAPWGSDDFLRVAGSYKPSVILDREVPGIDSVIADTATAFGKLAEILISAGHTSLAYIGGPEGSWQDQHRLDAVQAAAAQAGVPVSVFGPHPATYEEGMRLAQEVHATGCTAVIPYATDLGVGIQLALLAAGVSPLPQISTRPTVVHALGDYDVPTINVDGESLGRAAAEALTDRIESPQAERVTRRLPVAVSGLGAN